ncbi:MAG: hypothetical protein ABIP35_02655, partial [Ginsengibacter sp.]
IIKSIFGFYILFSQGDWFGASSILPQINVWMGVYLVASTFITIAFVLQHAREGKRINSEPIPDLIPLIN